MNPPQSKVLREALAARIGVIRMLPAPCVACTTNAAEAVHRLASQHAVPRYAW